MNNRIKSFVKITLVCVVVVAGIGVSKALQRYNDTLSKEVIPVSLTKEEREGLLKEIRENSAVVKKINGEDTKSEAVAAYLKLASAYERMGYSGKATAMYEEVLKRDDNNVSALVSLAMLQEKMERVAAAEESYKRLVAIQANARNYNLLGRFVLERKHDPQRARALYLEGLQKTNNDTMLMKYFANFLEAIGDRYEAYLYWDAAYRKEPSNVDLQNIVERLRIEKADVIRATESNK